GEEVEVVDIKGNRLVIRLVDVTPHTNEEVSSTDEAAGVQGVSTGDATVTGDRTDHPAIETERLSGDSISEAPHEPFVGENRGHAREPRGLGRSAGIDRVAGQAVGCALEVVSSRLVECVGEAGSCQVVSSVVVV